VNTPPTTPPAQIALIGATASDGIVRGFTRADRRFAITAAAPVGDRDSSSLQGVRDTSRRNLRCVVSVRG
jgi:hypothetical protein